MFDLPWVFIADLFFESNSSMEVNGGILNKV